ncbi:hypothetical protein FRX31_024017 [Thalictrum thalictroides]|uniref:DUF4283 domain-containing protein n=1 Tax=Thalictrum thalictroides TaxID=46969 RepID=A0A7J6VMR6_THATH|nr:hypothetical protein FRX31_024017 [Thalictrum thalictroides]
MGEKRVFLSEKRFVVAERKSFEFEWRKQAPWEEAIVLVERSSNGTFRSAISKEGGRWLAKALCQISLEREGSLGFNDGSLSINGVCRSNRLGKFFQITTRKRGTRNRDHVLRFPAGKDRNAWSAAGVKLMDLVNLQPKQETTQNEEGRIQKSNEWKNTRAWKDPREGEKRQYEAGRNMAVRIWSPLTQKNSSQWTASVVAKANTHLVDWSWVKSRVEALVGESTLKVLKSGEAFISMQSEEKALKLVDLDSFAMGGVRVNFQKWNPAMGRISEEELKPQRVKIRLHGLPLHLRSEDVAKQLAQRLSTSFEVLRDTCNIANPFVEVVLRDIGWEEIPRVMSLEERGFSFKIKVEGIKEVGGGSPQKPNQALEAVGSTQSPGGQNSGERIGEDEGEIDPIEPSASRVPETRSSTQHVYGATENDPTKGVADQWVRVTNGPTNNRPIYPKKATEAQTEANRFTLLRREVQEPGKSSQSEPVRPNTGEFFSLRENNSRFRSKSDSIISDIHANSGRVNQGPNPWGPSLVLSHRLLGSQNQRWKNRAGRNKAMAQRILDSCEEREGQETDRQRNALIQIASSSRSVSPSQINQKADEQRESNEKADLDRSSKQNSRACEPESQCQLLTMQEQGCESELSRPPGFGSQGADEVGKSVNDRLLLECCRVKTRNDLQNWITEVLRPIAIDIGVSSNKGGEAVEKFFYEIGLRSLKENELRVVNDDTREILNYRNSNEVLGQDNVD